LLRDWGIQEHSMLPVGTQGVANLLVAQASKVPAAAPGKGSSANDSTPGRGNDAAQRNAESRPAPCADAQQTSASAQVPADVPAQAKSAVANDKSSKKGSRGDKVPDATRNTREAGGASAQAADAALSFAAVFAQVGRRPYGRLRMTRGRCGSLDLQRMTLSFTTPRRF
jgi:hypothetical protein